MVAIVDTAPPLARDNSAVQDGPGSRDPGSRDPASRDDVGAGAKSAQAFRLRVLSALVLAPLGLAAAWFGPPLLSVVVAIAAGLMAWEWGRLCRIGTPILTGIVVIVVASVIAATLGIPRIGLAVAVLGSIAAAVASRGSGEAVLVGCGMLWIAVPSMALIWVALDPDAGVGRNTVLWILAVVWATDIGAYAAGRTFGGARLAPRLSPNKTWSGLIGGVVCAAAAGVVVALFVDSTIIVTISLLSGILAVVAQIGDLAESMAKRHFGVKDSSGLIPGHGGLLDRFDGMLTVIPAVALLSLFGGGSVLTWR
jgi:phosphatidate cytidylyltransferase